MLMEIWGSAMPVQPHSSLLMSWAHYDVKSNYFVKVNHSFGPTYVMSFETYIKRVPFFKIN